MPDREEIEKRIRHVLAQLKMLSEVRASTPGRSSPNADDPLGPPGTHDVERRGCSCVLGGGESKIENCSVHGPPRKEHSLFEWYRWQFERVDEPARRAWLCFMAERDYRERVEGLDETRIAGRPERTDEKEYVRLILATYEGVSSAEVAVGERLKVGWVEKIRSENDRDPETGNVRPNFRKRDDGERRRLIAGLCERGWKVVQVARYLGVSRGTVHRYWPREAMQGA